MKILLLFLITTTSLALLYPEQIHLSWTENANEMRVTWTSRMVTSPRLSYRLLSCNESSSFHSSPCHSSRVSTGRNLLRYYYIHTSTISNLIPSCTYSYQVSNGDLWSDTFTFTGVSPGIPALNSELHSLILIGDLGTYEYGQNTLKLLEEVLEKQEALGIVHLGDIAYDMQDFEGTVGDKFFRMVQPIAANYAYMAIPGNHEESKNFTHYKMRFKLPVNGANQGTGYFYSLDIGFIHYVFINTSLYLDKAFKIEAEVMTQWLSEDLGTANGNRELVPWVVVMQHHALYCNGDAENQEGDLDCYYQSGILREILEDLLYNNRVDLVIQAHVHNYQRLASIYKEAEVEAQVDEENLIVNAMAPVYMVVGNAGNRQGKNDPLPNPLANWTRMASNDFGFGRLQTVNRTTLYWEQYSIERYDIIDYFYLQKL